MAGDESTLRRCVVFGAAALYWGGVLVQARRVRRRIGRSPNLRPRNLKEMRLWLGWMLVVTAWLVQPWLLGWRGVPRFLQTSGPLVTRPVLALGILLMLAGYAGTLWCYASLGSAWRIGVDPGEKTVLVIRGPYRVVRHPIYLFQIVMLAASALLLPTCLSLAILALHYLCARSKALDEESHLLKVQGRDYSEYLARTGRFFPRLFPRPPRP